MPNEREPKAALRPSQNGSTFQIGKSSSKPIRCNPPHHTYPDTRTRAQYMQLITPNPNIYFSRPKMPPRRTQKRETVSGHLGNSDYSVSHGVDACLQVSPTPPNSAPTPPSHPAPSASDLPYPPSQRTLLLILMSPGSPAG